MIKTALITTLTVSLLLSACNFDDAAQSPGTATPVPTSATGKWQDSAQTSEMDDSTTISIQLRAEEPMTGWLEDFTPVLIVRCKEKTDVYIFTNTQSAVESGNLDGATVRLRFDDEPAREYDTSLSTDGKGLFFPKPRVLLTQIMTHDKLLFEFTPFNAATDVTSFDLRGAKEAAQPILEACAGK